MLTEIIGGPRAWRADTIDPPRSWYYPLSQRCLNSLDRAVQHWRHKTCPTTEVRVSEYPDPVLADELAPVRDVLEAGRGFTIVRGISPEGYSSTERQLLYWLVGQLLGTPVAQNVQGTLLYDVRDTGQEVRYGARFSVTNAESTFHTDNSFGSQVVDYVGLLCLQKARTGGLNQLLSAFALHNRLLHDHRTVLETLYRPFHIDRRGGVLPGEMPTVQLPILQWDGRELVCRYLRYWIEAGHDKAGEPLTPAQRDALDALDRVARDPSLQVEFGLEPGDLFFINNRWILHNRSGFEDYPEPERRRHLIRLWLLAKP
jgi:hypothetical protein